MNALKKTTLLAALLASLGFATGANAAVIDLFDDPTDPESHIVRDTTVNNGAGTALNPGFGTQVGNGWYMQYGSGPVSSPTLLGGYRDLYVEMTANVGSVPNSTLSAGGGELAFSNTVGTTGYAVVQWDGNDNSVNLNTTGLGGIDVTQGCSGSCSEFLAEVLQADQAFQYKITVWDMDGSGATLISDTLFEVASTTPASYLFDWFNLAAGSYFEGGLPFDIVRLGNLGDIDFTKLGALQFELNTDGTIAVDLRLGAINTVPEPGALALVGLALAGAGLAGKRRKSAQQG